MFAVLNFDIRSIPREDPAGFVAKRAGAEQEPAIGSIEAPQARFHVHFRTGIQSTFASTPADVVRPWW